MDVLSSLVDTSSGGLLPILVRPVREQLEHDRVIRSLQAKWRKRFDVATNVGEERNSAVRVGSNLFYPDLVFTAPTGRAVQGVVEVETMESVNHLEALAQWAHFGRTRAPFYLYVPTGAVEAARRLCVDLQVAVSEIWSYHAVADQLRFNLVHRLGRTAAEPAARRTPSGRSSARTAGATTPRRKAAARSAAKRTKRPAARRPVRKTARPQRRK
jgi:hypothetical protein